MKYLHNSKGVHIANFIDGQLYSTSGKNIGHYLENENIFIDMHGRYLGEILYDNRLLKNRNSGYRSTNFGNYGNYGNAGNYGNPGNIGSLGTVGGFEDIELEKLK